jgi:hypothetical protein
LRGRGSIEEKAKNMSLDGVFMLVLDVASFSSAATTGPNNMIGNFHT